MLGDRLREILAMKNMSQAALGRELGLSEGHMSRIMRNKVEPGVEKVGRMAKILGVPVSVLLEDTDKDMITRALAEDVINNLPGEIVDALAQQDNREWLFLGLDLKNSELTKEEISIIIDSYLAAKKRIERQGF